ncbi:hypothetical protein FOA52_000193 [Chlamydomonas sp. UWO 241]|nr:hypothetical protein FOA52_000193 [Chlamydomonas sp. UWO 241]
MPQVFCIIDEGGRTLLTKVHGDIQSPSFPTLGLLCSISTFASNAGFVVETFGTADVQIVYRRFDNHLLFVLATSNLLAHPQHLQTLLQVVFDGLTLLLGPQALEHVNGPGRLDALRKKLRGLSSLDALIADDALVPCMMLQAPQVLGLPARERQSLEQALTTMAGTGGTRLAALVMEGWYLAATPEWWNLTPHEQLLLQHLAADSSLSTGDEEPPPLEVYLSSNGCRSALSLSRIPLEYGLTILVVCLPDTDADAVIANVDMQIERGRYAVAGQRQRRSQRACCLSDIACFASPLPPFVGPPPDAPALRPFVRNGAARGGQTAAAGHAAVGAQ